jgi:thimet oligopeptidase
MNEFASDARDPLAGVDPVAQNLSAEGLRALCDQHLASARALLAEIKSLRGASPNELTWDATLGKLDRLSAEVSVAAGFPELMSVGHPDEAVREAGKSCRPKAVELFTDLMLDADFAAVIRAYADTAPALDGTRRRLLDDTLRDLRRNGLELSAEAQARLRQLNDELSRLAQDFEQHLSDASPELRVPKARLRGLTESFVAAHPPGDDGLVTLTTNYPDYFPVLQYAEDRELARELNFLFDSRAAEQNLPVLEQVLALRREKATLLGYESWAAYAIEPRMAKTPGAVSAFLDRAAELVREPAKREYAEFRAEHVALGGDADAPLPSYERIFLEERLRAAKYGFDSKRLSEYFEVRAVTQGMLRIYERLFGIRFVPDRDAPRWHPDVVALDVRDAASDAAIGRIYLDLYPREGKFKHAAMFEIRPGLQLRDGSYLAPISCLMCNFPRPGGEGPALLSHSDVTTFFHEYGHALHHVLSRQELASYSGTNTARDFVEVPSQMLEEWTFKRETLDLFARHHSTGAPIPDELFDAMSRSRAFGRALATERQISLATLDFEYHARRESFDTDEVLADVMRRTQSFAFQAGTHFQATFGHLMGYDAGYYGYQWALALARDVLTRFEAEGYMNPATARDWRQRVLEQGAGQDERGLLRAFLGREPDLEAYGAHLAGS